MRYTIKMVAYATMLLMLLTPIVYADTSEVSGWAAVIENGDAADAIALSVGNGDEITLASIAYVEGQDEVDATGNAYITGDVAGTDAGSSADIGDDYNSASAWASAHGIGDTIGYTFAHAWR